MKSVKRKYIIGNKEINCKRKLSNNAILQYLYLYLNAFRLCVNCEDSFRKKTSYNFYSIERRSTTSGFKLSLCTSHSAKCEVISRFCDAKMFFFDKKCEAGKKKENKQLI